MLSKHLLWCSRERQAARREHFGNVGMEMNPNVPPNWVCGGDGRWTGPLPDGGGSWNRAMMVDGCSWLRAQHNLFRPEVEITQGNTDR